LTYTFDVAAIAKWARVSGDYNPIHFDIARARAAGADDLIVHGMLPLLYVHQYLSTRLQSASRSVGTGSFDDGSALWPTIKTVFRVPVIKDRAHRLDLSTRGGRGRFTLRATQQDEDTLCGCFAFTNPVFKTALAAESGPPTFALAQPELADRIDEFALCFPEIDRLWIALGALAFGQFLSSHTPLARLATVEHVDGRRVRDHLLDDTLIVQTMHNIVIAPALANRTLRDSPAPGTLQCTLHPPTTLVNGGREVLGSFPFDIAIDGHTVMQMELGLLMRTAATTHSTIKKRLDEHR
jgi:MaoC like domain